MENRITSKRIQYIDIARLLAILAVLCLHIMGFCKTLYDNNNKDIFLPIANSICMISYFGVPFFLMISGTLLLNPSKKITTKKWLTHYCLRILITILIFGFATEFINITYSLYCSSNLSFSSLLNFTTISSCLRAILTFSYSIVGQHLWFLYAILIIYFILPILRFFTKRVNFFIYTIILLLLFILCISFPFINEKIKAFIGLSLPSMHQYLFFYLLGYYLYKYILTKLNLHIFIVSLIVVVLSITGIIFFNITNIKYLTGESSVCNIIYCVFLFILCMFIKNESLLAKKFNSYFFGIYLLHPLFYSYFDFSFLTHILPLPLFFIIIFSLDVILSLGVTYLLKLLPICKNFIIR